MSDDLILARVVEGRVIFNVFEFVFVSRKSGGFKVEKENLDK